MRKNTYPFTAVVGQDTMKKALLLNVINPQIGGVLINGQKGTAKSTIVRALANLVDCSIIDLPLSVSEDRLVGSIDMEKTLAKGNIQLEHGLLYDANEQILYVDEVNLLQDSIVDILLEVSANGVNRIERESLSYTHPSKFVLIGTMNAEEGLLRPHFLDRFGLFVDVVAENDPIVRVDIVKKRMQYEQNSVTFNQKYHQSEKTLKQQIIKAKDLLREIIVSPQNRQLIIQLCLEANIQGHRGDLVLEQTAKALAAFYGRTTIADEDIKEAAVFVLSHRKKESEPQQQQQQEEPPKEEEQQEQQDAPPPSQEQQEEDSNHNENSNSSETDASTDAPTQTPNKASTQQFEVGQDFQLQEFGHNADRKARTGHGKRTNIRSATKSGRYLYATMQRRQNDLALDATIRAAAPFQPYRDKKGKAIAIHSSDIREKVRQKKMANILVFVVDASGSMGANQRMIETKGAILSLLKDAYIKRDKVALVVFRGDGAQVALPPTRSVERGYRLLETLEVGGKTPLNAGLIKGVQVIKSELQKEPNCMPMLVVITDGKGNVSLNSEKKPKAELIEMAEKIKHLSVANSMVIDIEKKGFMQFGIAKDLAESMGAKYYSVDTLKKDSILQMVERLRDIV